jgi:hypothetical protein
VLLPVTCAIVIPSYKETLALSELFLELQSRLTTSDALIVLDDSPEPIATQLNFACIQVLKNSSANYFFVNHQGKSGRGDTVRRGMGHALTLFPNLKFVVACEAVGYHRSVDILRVKNVNSRPTSLLAVATFL